MSKPQTPLQIYARSRNNLKFRLTGAHAAINIIMSCHKNLLTDTELVMLAEAETVLRQISKKWDNRTSLLIEIEKQRLEKENGNTKP